MNVLVSTTNIPTCPLFQVHVLAAVHMVLCKVLCIHIIRSKSWQLFIFVYNTQNVHVKHNMYKVTHILVFKIIEFEM